MPWKGECAGLTHKPIQGFLVSKAVSTSTIILTFISPFSLKQRFYNLSDFSNVPNFVEAFDCQDGSVFAISITVMEGQ